ncbi:MAG TPA: hypothetical protein VGO92_07595 [Acidimicrobiales bacterium]|nr:hypothetical protein [Acidimicrobiales bacterium]
MSGGRMLAAAVLMLGAAVAGTAGCGGSKGAADGSGRAGRSTTSSAPSTVDVARANAAAPVDPATGKQPRVRPSDRYSAAAPPPAGLRAADQVGAAGAVPLSASVAPACVEHGHQVVVVVKSDPGMTVAAQIKWPNEQFSGLDATRGTTSADGTLTWRVTATPAALYGEATLQAAAIDEKNGSRAGSTGSWQFVVAPPGRC